MRTNDTRVPVTLLTGFLGSGKTTLLRRLLTEPGMEGTAVLINEFGEIGLDHLLVKSVHGSAVVLQNGCICCTLQADLQDGLRNVIDGRADGSFPEFDRIVVETTGLADPAPIIQTLILDQMLKHQVRLANTIVTLDAVNGVGQLGTHIESVRQLAVADRLVITKTDLASAEAQAELRRDIARLNPTAWVYNAQGSDFTARSLLVEGLADPATKLAEVKQWLRYADGPDHGHDHRHGHDHHDHHDQDDAVSTTHSTNIQSFSLRITEPIDWTAFGVWLTALLHRHGAQVLRVKGLLNVSDALGPVVLHGVQHIIHTPLHLDEWPDEDTSSRVVFIVQDIDPALIRESLFSYLAAARGENRVHAGAA
jgi:G3E family GTPase